LQDEAVRGQTEAIRALNARMDVGVSHEQGNGLRCKPIRHHTVQGDLHARPEEVGWAVKPADLSGVVGYRNRNRVAGRQRDRAGGKRQVAGESRYRNGPYGAGEGRIPSVQELEVAGLRFGEGLIQPVRKNIGSRIGSCNGERVANGCGMAI
jgi:hypothetical protein